MADLLQQLVTGMMPTLPDAADLLTTPGYTPQTAKAAIARYDALLLKLPRPLPLRGLALAGRARALLANDQVPEAMANLEEAMRLIPGFAWPKLMASYALTFLGAPERAADLWLEVSQQSASIAREADGYALYALIGRLNDKGEERRANAVAARMAEIGFSGESLNQRSAAALAAAKAMFKSRGAGPTIPLLGSISRPGDMQSLYLDRRYEALWPAIAQSSGHDLSLLQGQYFRSLRADFQRSGSFVSAWDYAQALSTVKARAAVVTTFQPLLASATPERLEREGGYPFLLSVVARTLGEVGRFREAEQLFAEGEALMPSKFEGIRLNFSANRLVLLMRQHRYEEVRPLANAWLAKASALGPEINQSGILSVMGVRACAAIRSGHRAEALADTVSVIAARYTQPTIALQLYACANDKPKAVELIRSMLANEPLREAALEIMQPAPPFDAASDEPDEYAFFAALSADPQLKAEATKVGRILPAPILTSLPTGFDPLIPDAPIRAGPDSI